MRSPRTAGAAGGQAGKHAGRWAGRRAGGQGECGIRRASQAYEGGRQRGARDAGMAARCGPVAMRAAATAPLAVRGARCAHLCSRCSRCSSQISPPWTPSRGRHRCQPAGMTSQAVSAGVRGQGGGGQADAPHRQWCPMQPWLAAHLAELVLHNSNLLAMVPCTTYVRSARGSWCRCLMGAS
jgi:hypothetical protein